jgi:phosphohistidine swiveling domain-containing protein/DNA-binding Xre family transcriptional regulator
MISLNLKNITEKTGKNLSEIAREIGVNRNTIQSFASGKAGGIRFSTLEKLMKTFGLSLNDLLVSQIEEKKPQDILPKHIYRQEAEAVPFTLIFPVQWAAQVPSPDGRWPSFFGNIHFYSRDQYSEAFLDEANMRASASGMLKLLSKPVEFDTVWQKFLKGSKQLEEIYYRLFDFNPQTLSTVQIISLHKEISQAYEIFWRSSIFIDAFDIGIDQEEINILIKKYNLTKEDSEVLTTPTEKIFSQEKLFEFLKLVQRYSEKNFDQATLVEHLTRDHAFQSFRKKFDAAGSNYAVVNHITVEETAAEIIKTLTDQNLWREQIINLAFYEKTRRSLIKNILVKRHLTNNPLWVFERLTFFREARKKYNLMGIHALDILLSAIERLTGIPKKYLQHLLPDEVELVLRGRIGLEELKRRREEGVMYVLRSDGSISLIYGSQAESIKKDLEGRMGIGESLNTLSGQTACQGYAKGVARVILDVSQFDRFHEGEILVTGMTRPEFVPLMKKAAGIVTNEGGITCHAAIVSRELGVPCIIGTKVATKVIPDGAWIEVRANHGTIRILENEGDKKDT